MEKIDHLLIFEPESSGHQPLFIRLLYDYVVVQKPTIKVTFVIHRDTATRIDKEDSIQLQRIEDKVDIILLRDTEIAASARGRLWVRALHNWRLMKKYMKLTGAEHGHFLHLDHMQLPLALRLHFLPGKQLSGLLFRPPMLGYCEGQLSLKEHLKDYRKKWLYSRMLSNKMLHFAYTLNPLFAAYAKKHFFCGDKVFHLPDPSMYPQTDITLSDDDCAIAEQIDKKRKSFLLFGALTKRKGIFEVLEAVKHLDRGFLSQIAIVFAGKLEQEIRTEFLDKAISCRNNNSAIDIHIIDRFLSTNEIISLLKRCNVVLATYARGTTGSSGVLLWAVGAKKPLIAPNFGLIGYQMRKYDLGISVDTTSPQRIADAFTRYLHNPTAHDQNTSGMEKLYAESLTENFARVFFARFL